MPSRRDMATAYINATCKVGQGSECGKPATHLAAVAAVADTGWATASRPGGIVGLCEFHASTPVVEWDAPNV
jgi:uncharacterized NAD-dependent epimerase/dehydratase family protein